MHCAFLDYSPAFNSVTRGFMVRNNGNLYITQIGDSNCLSKAKCELPYHLIYNCTDVGKREMNNQQKQINGAINQGHHPYMTEETNGNGHCKKR